MQRSAPVEPGALGDTNPIAHQDDQTRMPALTSLRFFAAFYVVIFHAYPRHEGDPSAVMGTLLGRAWYQFCSHGYTAVSFFFVLSGFILATNYPTKRDISRRWFYRARFARIYPVYVLGLAAALPFLVARTLRDGNWGSAALECALAFTLLQAWVPSFWNAVNIPGWSLSIETFFYAIFPLIVGFLSRFARTPARAFGLLLGLYVCSLVAPAIGAWAFGIGYANTSVMANIIRYFPLLSLPEFAFGIVLGHMRLRGLDQPHIARRLFGPALVVLALLLTTDVVPYLLQHNGALLPIFAVIILRCAQGADVPGLLRHSWVQLLGEASYSLYVLHLLIWIYVKIVIERSGLDPESVWVFPVYAVIAISTSLATYLWLEKPSREWLHASRRRQLPMSSAAAPQSCVSGAPAGRCRLP